jgi:hypothetical protein
MLRTVVIAVTAVLALTACSDSQKSGASSQTPPVPCGTLDGHGCAPRAERVDLNKPSFTHSTEITNPLFPISNLRSAVLLGHVEGKPFRTETTLLPGTHSVEWGGRRIPVLLSQYMAYKGGRLEEVALDRYAQADDGSVWYFGEDVFDYKNGTVALTEGTWLAGKEGPPAMIMPANPKLGDVYRTENAPPVVFEEVTVKSVGQTVAGPTSPVDGAMVARELHSDGTSEDKVFAPGYGEFRTAGGGDLEALALAVPRNARPGPSPPELQALLTDAVAAVEFVRLGEWDSVSSTVLHMNALWQKLRTRDQPHMVAARIDAALEALTHAAEQHQPRRISQAAIDAAQSTLDLQLRYRPAAQIDAGRFRLWTQQLRLDAAANDLGAVTGDIAVLEWIRERFAYVVPTAARADIDARLRDLRATADARNLPGAADHAARLASRLRLQGLA